MKKLLFFSTLFATIFIFSCKKNDGNHGSSNLITNPSFENNGDTSFQGWKGSNYSFVNDTPPGGGQWALQLVPEWYGGEGHAEYVVTGISGNYHFNLSCMAKCNYWHGSISLRKKNHNGVITKLGETSFSNDEWQAITLNTATISLAPSDQLIIHLSAGATEIATGSVFFDSILLQVQ